MIRDASVCLSQAEAADLDGPDRGDADHALGVDHELLAGDVEPTDELDLDHVTRADSIVGSRYDAADAGAGASLKAGVRADGGATGSFHQGVRGGGERGHRLTLRNPGRPGLGCRPGLGSRQ